MKTLKLHKMALAAASLAMVASAAHAIPENGLGGISIFADELPYVVLDADDDGGTDGWHRDAPSDGEAEVLGGGGADDGGDSGPNSSTKG